MDHIWMEQADLLRDNESFVVATIVEKSGSAPRSSGAKMLVRRSGEIFGTIGGGKLEAEAIRRALDSLKNGTSRIYSFSLTGKDAAETEMICGGAGEIFLDFVDATKKTDRAVFQAIAEGIDRHEKCWMVTELDPDGISRRCAVLSDGTLVGDFSGSQDLLEKLTGGPALFSIHSEVLADRRMFVEPIRETGTVFLFGAGHVAKCIAPIAESVGFRTTVIDDRRDFASPERFPRSVLVVPASLDEPLPHLDFDEDSYLVIVTRGHLNDQYVLEQVIDRQVAYIGMIGSRKKRDLVYKYLMEERGVEKERLAFVHSPIGIAIPAETPEEIAISVVAELIQVRAERMNG
jgi:xanthine dehydrogenase accessory factor